jgi:hypothetical protein
MNPMFEPNAIPSGQHPAIPALLFHVEDDNPQMARVAAAQQLLFPSNPRAICDELGLNWWAALKLHQDGWLSFSPEHLARLDEAQETELRFVGTLVTAGCDQNMLRVLLAGLHKPYAYDLKRLFFDWHSRHWRLLPDPRSYPETAFTDWLELLVQTADVGSLTGIVELTQDALARVRPSLPHSSHSRHYSVTDDGEGTQG